MIWYHIYVNGEGPKVGFLCVGDSFDVASDAADKLVDEEKVMNSIWILDRKDLIDLRDSINRELSALDETPKKASQETSPEA